ncbi:hypothetical protein ACHAXT_004105 [Thalassiosira profunda]
MLRDLVGRSAVGAADLEAVTAERDFFKDKYVHQIDELESLKNKLKESQRVIDRLRSQVLELEGEKARQGGAAPLSKTIATSGSSSTSTTCLTQDDDLTAKSGVENNEETADNGAGSSDVGLSTNVTSAAGGENCDAQDVHTPKEDEEASAAGGISDGESDNDEESDNEDDEAEKIRANAERMLMWANYQTSKRSTPNASVVLDDDSKTDMESRSDAPPREESDRLVYSLPTSLDRRQSPMDDDSTLGSHSRQQSIRSGNASTERAGSGKIGKLLGNLRDMIEPPSESESDECSDEEDSVLSGTQHEH